jgi:hypothetical protein
VHGIARFKLDITTKSCIICTDCCCYRSDDVIESYGDRSREPLPVKPGSVNVRVSVTGSVISSSEWWRKEIDINAQVWVIPDRIRMWGEFTWREEIKLHTGGYLSRHDITVLEKSIWIVIVFSPGASERISCLQPGASSFALLSGIDSGRIWVRVRNGNEGDFVGETDFSILSAGHARFAFVWFALISFVIPFVAHHDADLLTAFVGACFIVPTV